MSACLPTFSEQVLPKLPPLVFFLIKVSRNQPVLILWRFPVRYFIPPFPAILCQFMHSFFLVFPFKNIFAVPVVNENDRHVNARIQWKLTHQPIGRKILVHSLALSSIDLKKLLLIFFVLPLTFSDPVSTQPALPLLILLIPTEVTGTATATSAYQLFCHGRVPSICY